MWESRPAPPRLGEDPEGHEAPREEAVPGHSKTLGVKGASDSEEGVWCADAPVPWGGPSPNPFLVKQDSCVGGGLPKLIFSFRLHNGIFFFKVYNAVIYLTQAHAVE